MAATTDAHGWPTEDAQTVIFDIRPFPAWSPPIDDPDRFQPDWSGIYHLSFRGQAILSFVEEQRNSIANVRYDRATNTTRAELTVRKGVGLVILSFTQTRRTANSTIGSGITDLRVIRPGYAPDTREVFTNEFLRSLKPFAVLRYMDWLDTNHNPGYYGDTGHHLLDWKNRRLPSDATQQDTGDRYGISWEYIVQLANRTEKDLWINVPVAATDAYVKELAAVLHRDLSPNLKIYIEHSNEVWNFGFPQYIYNKLAAIDEVRQGSSVLNGDGSADQETWARRRHAKRLVEIGAIFRRAFGETTSRSTPATGRIRPIYASWVINPKDYYADVLAWVEKNYGAPGRLFYGVAGAAYFNADRAGQTAAHQ